MVKVVKWLTLHSLEAAFIQGSTNQLEQTLTQKSHKPVHILKLVVGAESSARPLFYFLPQISTVY